MKEEVVFHGVVLSSAASREYDKRLTVLTKEAGRITVWAPGAKKMNSPLLAATRSFVFAEFTLTPGRSGYNLRSVRVSRMFEEIAADIEYACYGSYLLELADYMSQENLEAEDMINLLYYSLHAILNARLENALVRRIFELRMMCINGEYTEYPPLMASESCRLAWRHVLESPLEKLYTFTLKEKVMQEFEENVDYLVRGILPYASRSLQILNAL